MDNSKKLLLVVEKKKFRDANPDYVKGKDCLYVGKTTHHPKCRQSMHNNCKSKDWKEKNWTCYCWKSNGSNKCELVNLASKFVAPYNTGYLQRVHYAHRNPRRYSEAGIEEKKLAKDLQNEGFGVWTN